MMTKEDYNRQYKENQEMRDRVKKDQNRLCWHLMPPTGWLNDPNGLCQKDGVYHIYFQYTPFNSGWGTKLWGHYTTKDLLTFKEEPPFLFPDQCFDKDGVYSGSAFVENGAIHYFYTGNVKYTDKKSYDYINEGREQNTIYLTSTDGLSHSKKNLLLTNEDYPKEMSKHVRDPKIFKKDGIYYMVLGARTKADRGCVLLYRSQDLEHFHYYNCIATPQSFGFMWECPDLFELDGHLFLMVCPQGVAQKGYDFENIYQTGYFEVQYNFEKNIYSLGAFRALDHGFDLYAPQSFLDEKGRRIQWAWMGIPDADYHNTPTVKYDWQHALTMPKVLTAQKGQIYQQPPEEMKSLRQKKIQTTIGAFNQTTGEGLSFEMDIHFKKSEDFKLQIRADVTLGYQNKLLTLALGKSGCGRKERHIILPEIHHLTIFSDTSSLEIFINKGQEVMTTRVYSEPKKQQPRFLTEHEGEVTFYGLKGYGVI